MPLKIEFPESLPVSGKRDEIMAAIAQHQVVIVCGETGSGKTTQLPKIALAMGRGKCNAPPDTPPHKRQMIGHTQPRRIAASSVAKRIAQELQTPLGDVVGFKVRFQDRLSKDASVKLMTDGILLAETQTDPLLKAYDTLIIDEAHERSLNIDFLLGYLREILPRRPDLKIIVTSATIDADRFARHFASRSGPAPVIMVSGRMFPVEQRYRPFEESRDYDLNHAIADGVDELWRDPRQGGDILVFLPGEREIREAADHLRKHLSHQPLLRGAEVLPLFARLSQAEQDRVFDTHGGRRIVLATNVAETSLTVPGIRYVIDGGTARLKRYSFRSKVEQLLVEPISQAAANQRAGRCGRVADGICIRLYDDKDFAGRPRFTEPEILRSSLAGVILRMKGLRLGDVERFPFLEAPRPKAIADGYQLLAELGAVDDANELTAIGHELSKLPLDPRVGRMILEARQRGAMDEMLVIASAMSVQDVRDRPMEAQAQADQAHAKFDDDKSEFSGYLRLWDWLDAARGGHGTDHKLSNRQFEGLLRQNFINVRRLREWRDIHSQLLTVVAEHGWAVNTAPASFEAIHLSLLAGMLGNVGYKLEDEDIYLGARGIKFHRHPGAHLKKKPGRWIVCAELVETTRLFGRGIANIEPQWVEQVAGHLLKKQLLDPHWEKKAGEVVALERATLYGLVIYSGRRVNFGRIDPVGAREVFIREALVAGEWETKLPFLAANAKLITQVEDLEHKSRRQDVLVDEELIYAFYDGQLPTDIHSGAGLEHWYKEQQRLGGPGTTPLRMTRDELMRHEAAGITAQTFPRTLRLGGVDCKTTYLHEPGDAKDGVTVEVPLFALNQVNEDQCEWLVPGMLKDKVLALLKSLPQRPRSRFVPLPDAAERLSRQLSATAPNMGLTDALLRAVREASSLDVKRTDFKLETLKPHLFMNFRVVDEHGRQLGTGRNLAALKAELGKQARGAFQALAALRGLPSQPVGANAVVQTKGSPKAEIKPGLSAQSISLLATKNSAGNRGKSSAEGLESAVTTAPNAPTAPTASTSPNASTPPHSSLTPALAHAPASAPAPAPTPVKGVITGDTRYTAWTFGDLPELLEIHSGKQSLIGFPALIDRGDAVTLEVFDEPDIAAARHRLGLARLFALQIKDALKYLEKNIPDLQTMGVQYMQVGRVGEGTSSGGGGSGGGSGGGTVEELRAQIVAVALDRAFLADPLPADEYAFKRRVEEGRQRLTLICNEVARLCGQVLSDYATAQRKLKDNKNYPPATAAVADAVQQLQRLMPKRFLSQTAWGPLQHTPRYLKAITLRLDKLRADPARDAAKLAELRPLEQAYWRLVAERKGAQDERLLEFRWLLEELRVSFFAQELRTPQPVSVKRLEKAWGQVGG